VRGMWSSDFCPNISFIFSVRIMWMKKVSG
jgi:hypothetical protein